MRGRLWAALLFSAAVDVCATMCNTTSYMYSVRSTAGGNSKLEMLKTR